MTFPTRAVAAALLGFGFAGPPAAADIGAYEFQLVQPTPRPRADAVITVRLVERGSDRQVADAVIFATRLDMAPDGMAEMATAVTTLPTTDGSGLYRFKAEISMAGRWRLSLAAKVQGEVGTVRARLIFEAAP
ncbi:hypothetical protein BN1110_04446 [bacterium YEK0313]|nr:hypothetical protein BN1110_04446 [bacterium YEK0313]